MLADLPSIYWHRLLIGLAGRVRHPQAAVYLDAHRDGLSLHFHGLGGDLARRLATDTGTGPGVLGATHRGNDLAAWLESDQLHLPARINRYASIGLNRDLYYWLAAFLACDRPLVDENALPGGVAHLLRGIATSTRVLGRYPGLAERYQRLCDAELALRHESLPALGLGSRGNAHRLEAGIRCALGGSGGPEAAIDSWLSEAITAARQGQVRFSDPGWGSLPVPFLPVFVWGHRAGEVRGLRLRWLKRRIRRRARGERRALATPSFSTEELPGPAAGPRVFAEHVYREWDHAAEQYREQWCRVIESVPPPSSQTVPGRAEASLVRKVSRQFETMRDVSAWHRGHESGDELDIDAFVDSVADARSSGSRNTRLYRRRERSQRDLSVAVLLDVSRSTQAWVGERRAIDVARSAVDVLAQALTAIDDDFALYAFASDSRMRVNCYRLKDFTDCYDSASRGRLAAIEPRDYTRMGAAIRHVGVQLARRRHAHKLMLVISDGRPHDPVDGYAGRYALEDTRRSIIELRGTATQCFGLAIDLHERDYLGQLFGPGHYAVLSRLQALTTVLPRLYARITGLHR